MRAAERWDEPFDVVVVDPGTAPFDPWPRGGRNEQQGRVVRAESAGEALTALASSDASTGAYREVVSTRHPATSAVASALVERLPGLRHVTIGARRDYVVRRAVARARCGRSMNPTPRALILVRSTDDAERAARFVEGDADIEVGDAPPPADRDRDGPGYASVVVAGDLADDAWLSAACRRAAGELCAGGRLLVVLADTNDRTELPADVAEAWRVVGAVAEHSSAAVVLARASDVDGAADTDAAFGSWQQFATHAGAAEERGRAMRAADETDALERRRRGGRAPSSARRLPQLDAGTDHDQVVDVSESPPPLESADVAGTRRERMFPRTRRLLATLRNDGFAAFGAAGVEALRWRAHRWTSPSTGSPVATTGAESPAARPAPDVPAAAALWRAPGHFYSPIVDPLVAATETQRLWPSPLPTSIPGVELRIDEQASRLAELARFHDAFPDYGPDVLPDLRFRTENRMYGLGDAGLLYAFMRHEQPKRIVEVGSGFSSAVVLDTADRFLDDWPSITFIEPHPERLYSILSPGDPERVEIIQARVQDVGLERLPVLEANDILIIDSSHVVKTASDVNFLYFEVLPRLQPGVLVHIHDIPYPFEYPRRWVEEGRSWNEAYLLRALLMFNGQFDVELWNSCLSRQRPQAYEDCPRFAGGSQIWVRRRTD